MAAAYLAIILYCAVDPSTCIQHSNIQLNCSRPWLASTWKFDHSYQKLTARLYKKNASSALDRIIIDHERINISAYSGQIHHRPYEKYQQCNKIFQCSKSTFIATTQASCTQTIIPQRQIEIKIGQQETLEWKQRGFRGISPRGSRRRQKEAQDREEEEPQWKQKQIRYGAKQIDPNRD